MRFSNLGAIIENTLRDRILKNYFQNRKRIGLLLDLGCGPRPYLHLYAPCCDKTLGADLPDSPFPKDKIDIYCSATQIPLENNSVDAVLSTEVMHDMAEPDEMLAEINRILHPGGSVILTTPFVVPIVDGVYDHYRYTEHGLRYLLTKQGFEVEKIIPVSDVLGAMTTLAVKPWLKIWNVLAKATHIKLIYSVYNPFLLVTVVFPQVMYLWTSKLPLIKQFYKRFSYGAIGYVSIARKKS